MASDKNLGGRPIKIESVEILDKAINYYFDSITKTSPVFDHVVTGYEDEEKKKPIIEKQPRLNNVDEQLLYTEYFEIPSITGLCQSIGITRDTWNTYEKREGFFDSIKRAKERIEKYNVEQLYRKDQVTGVIFNLKNNFGWADRQEIQSTIDAKVELVDDTKIEQLMAKATDEELDILARADAIMKELEKR
jgi:hypothetical protein